jgi:nickel-dependent lactate racemase
MSDMKLPQLLWFGSKALDINFPDNWEVEIRKMAGHDRQALTPSQIREAVRNPLGTPPIRALAKGKKQIAIIFDDVQRPTRVSQIIPFVLEELAVAGIADNTIRFIGAVGCHSAMDRVDFAKKLGENVVRRFPVYNHNAFGNCIKVGTTSYGTDVFANAEVMSCDLKIAIGSVLPHPAAGFGGGAKIVMPGICSFETNQAFHQFGFKYRSLHPEVVQARGVTKDNPLRLNNAEATKLVGLDVKIDTLINTDAEIVSVFAGAPDIAFEAACKEAKTHYLTKVSPDKDVVVANTYSKVGEFQCGLEIAYASLKKEGGDVVIIANSPNGHVAHYLFGSWGNARRPGQIEHGLPPSVNRLFILNEYPEMSLLVHMGSREKISVMTSWREVLEQLKKSYPDKAQVAVFPGADIQFTA